MHPTSTLTLPPPWWCCLPEYSLIPSYPLRVCGNTLPLLCEFLGFGFPLSSCKGRYVEIILLLLLLEGESMHVRARGGGKGAERERILSSLPA